MRLETCVTAGAFVMVIGILCSCFMTCESKPHGTYYHATPMAPDRTSLQSYNLLRPQRSIYGGSGWNGGGIGGVSGGIEVAPVGLGHITKEELIALLEAWKEIEDGVEKPEPEDEPEPEPAPPPPQAKPPKPEAPKLPPPGVPLTVSLPAFVPIQLQAMYTAPAPAKAPETAGGAEEAGGSSGSKPEIEAAEAPEPAPAKDVQQTLLKLWTPQTGKQTTTIYLSNGGASKKALGRVKASSVIKFSKPRNFGSFLHHAGSAPRIYSAPPPPYLSNAPGPLKLVPSSQLLSNWR